MVLTHIWEQLPFNVAHSLTSISKGMYIAAHNQLISISEITIAGQCICHKHITRVAGAQIGSIGVQTYLGTVSIFGKTLIGV